MCLSLFGILSSFAATDTSPISIPVEPGIPPLLQYGALGFVLVLFLFALPRALDALATFIERMRGKVESANTNDKKTVCMGITPIEAAQIVNDGANKAATSASQEILRTQHEREAGRDIITQKGFERLTTLINTLVNCQEKITTSLNALEKLAVSQVEFNRHIEGELSAIRFSVDRNTTNTEILLQR